MRAGGLVETRGAAGARKARAGGRVKPTGGAAPVPASQWLAVWNDGVIRNETCGDWRMLTRNERLPIPQSRFLFSSRLRLV